MLSERISRRSPSFSTVTVSCCRVSTTFTGTHPSSSMSLRSASSVGSSPHPAMSPNYRPSNYRPSNYRPSHCPPGRPERPVLASGAEGAADAAERGRHVVAQELESADAHERDQGEQQGIFHEAGSPLVPERPRRHLTREQRPHNVPLPDPPTNAAHSTVASIQNAGAFRHSALGSFPDKSRRS